MDIRTLLWKLTILILLSLSQAKRPFIIELSNFTCVTVDASFAHEFSCVIHRKRIYPGISVRFILKKTQPHFDIQFHLDVLKKDNTKMTIANTKLDGCKYLGAFYSDNIFGKFFKRLHATSNLPKKCPVQGNKLFEIRNYTFLADEYPPAVPALTYQLRLQIMKSSIVVGDIFVQGSVIY